VLGWAPGRVNLIGEHVDYCGGFVLPAAIDRGTVVAAGPGEAGVLRAVSREQPGREVVVKLGQRVPAETPAWGRYVAGVVYELGQAGVKVDGLQLAVASDVPVGAGLSSSAAIEVSAARAVLGLAGREMDGLLLARLCQTAEREHAGVPCGIMDQYAAVFGRAGAAVLIDCHELTHRYVHIDAQVSIVVIDSGVKHELAGGEYADRRAACERGLAAAVGVLGPRATLRHVRVEELGRLEGAMGEEEFRRVRHVVGECARTVEAGAALERRDFAGAGRSMFESHASLRDDFEVSCVELDEIVEEARGMRGVYGARMTGGGFGGSAVALVETARAAEVMRGLEKGGRRCFVIRPGDGAGAETVA
jgi:galactokinase